MYKCFLSVFALLAMSVPSRAAVIIAVQDANITTNGTGYVDVLISSSIASEQLALTGFNFQITGSPGLTGTLEFLAEPDPLNVSPPNYVFGPGTGNYFDSLPSSTEISGGDSFAEFGDANVTITTMTQTLVRLNLLHTAIGDPALAVGSMFTIGLDPLAANDFSFWDDSDPNPDNHEPMQLDIHASSFANIGEITITSAAVPEPSTFAIMAMVGAGVIGRKLRRRTTVPVKNNEPPSDL
jgi:hypothetical protein